MAVTFRDAINRFLDQLPSDLSPSVRCRYHAAVAKHMPWQIYRRFPVTSYSPDPLPEALAGKTPATTAQVRRDWSRLGRFLARPSLTFLTLGDGIDAFLAVIRSQVAGPHGVEQVRSSLRVVAREYICSLPLSDLDVRLARSLWDHPWESARQRDAVRQFLRFLQTEQLLPYRLVELKPPRQPRPLQHLLATASPAASLSEHSPLQACAAYYLHHLQDATNRTDQGIKHVFEQLRKFATWCASQGIEQVGGVTRRNVDGFLAFQEKERGNGPSTLRSTILTLRAFFSFLVEEQVLSENPVQGIISKPISKQPPAAVLTDHEAARLTAVPRRLLADLRAKPKLTVPDKQRLWLLARDIAILELLMHTGIRSGELRNLTSDQIDLRRGRIRIVGKGDARYDVKERWVYLEAPSVVRALEEYLAVRPPELGTWLFVTARGSALSSQQLFVRVRRYAREAGVSKPLSPHRLRAHFASSLVAHGIDPLALQALMGHRSLRTTFRHYVALDEEHLHTVWRATNPLAHLRLDQEEESHE